MPGSGRPRDCLGGSICRYGTRHDKPSDCLCFQMNKEPNDDAKGFRDNSENGFTSSTRDKARWRLAPPGSVNSFV
jgi:hypothetical protein